jgi:2-polyprenyl-6-methoxyphenol hydroxylase-like FAD-dependent oxidoreductase
MTNLRECDVAIVGGGLGGLALAVGLRNIGLNAQLYEAFEELRTATGTLIGIGDNAMHALDALDPKIAEGIRCAVGGCCVPRSHDLHIPPPHVRYESYRG